MKTTLATVVAALALSSAGTPAFDAETFLGRVLKMSESTPREELESMVKSAEENGKEVADAVVSRLKGKDATDEDKFRYAWILGVAEQTSSSNWCAWQPPKKRTSRRNSHVGRGTFP